jgi:hypothetical protein
MTGDKRYTRALEITSKFEGASWGTVTGNIDGQILSVGILQWNVGQGTLYPLIVDSTREDMAKFREIFGDDARAVQMAAKYKDRSYFANMLEDDGKRVREEWRKRWSAWGRAFQSVQLRGAEPYFKAAERLQAYLQLTSERSFYWAFDFVVQAGGIGPARDIIEAHKKRLLALDEDMRMHVVTIMRASTVRREFAYAFISRKLAIVHGIGWVNGALVEVPRRETG